jgi:predicted RNA binding protein YcfA (HicA-like mRNA interferase family)
MERERRRRLRDRVAQHPKTVRFEDLCRLLEAYGWTLDRTGGSHHVYRRSGASITVPFRRPTVLPVYVRQVLALVDAQDAEEDEDDDE